MARYIDADKLIRFTNNTILMSIDANDIARFPTEDVAPAKHAKWFKNGYGTYCSNCKLYAYRDKFDKPWESDYCPYCGAKMNGE